MQKIYKLSFTVVAVFLITLQVGAQNNFFTDKGENKTVTTTGQRLIIPQKFRTSAANVIDLKNFLWSLPSENNFLNNRSQAPVISLPMPDGKMARFHVWESNLMEPGLAAKFPEMRTFAGQGIDDPYATIRFDYNPYFGFHAQILSAVNGRVFINPYARYDVKNYISYYTKDNRHNKTINCETESISALNRTTETAAGPCRGTQLFTYRLALACTGEYAVAVAGVNPTVPIVAAAMLTSVNRVSGVFEIDAAIRLVLVANNDLLINLNGATDPYSNNNGGTMLGQNQTNIDNVIGTANYDVGHVFSTGGGGVAGLGVICLSGNKARGVTGSGSPVGDDFDIDYVAHEIGHQFAGNHTFNSSTGSCGGGNRNGSTAYEVGAGTTVMSYAGICGTDNTQPHSDPFFHSVSFDEISTNAAGSGNSCAAKTNNGNILPVITAMNNNGVSIPVRTPFTLTGSATDANGDALTYCWEEWDLGNAGAWNSGANSTTDPLFKSRPPKATGSRTFPDMAVIVAGYPTNPASVMGGLKGETLPNVARTLKFRLTVRDNRAGGGGVVTGGDGCQAGFTSPFQVNVFGSTPFVLSAPNGGEVYSGGSTQTATWDVAGTDAAPISTANVRLTLSTDGGLTYPIELIASTPNDGTQQITIPCLNSNTARIRVEAVGNIFFDISNANFSIVSGFDFNSPAPVASPCIVPASMSASLATLTPCGFANPITLSASGNPAGTTVSFSPNPVTPGSTATVTLNGTNTLTAGTYTVTVTGTAAGTPIKTRNLSFVINAAINPSVTTPPAVQTVCAGGNATFTVTAANASTYQWQVSTAGGPFSDISGATLTSYTATGITAGMSGNQYRVVLTSACATSATSTAAVLTVISPVIVAVQPVASVICSESSTSFTVTGTSTQPIVYQWQVSTDGGNTYNNISNGGFYSGATTATLTVVGANTSINNNRYRVQLSNASCTAPTNSNGVLLTVRQLPSITLTAAPRTSLLPGQTTTLTSLPSASTGGTLSTTWLYNGAPAAPAIPGNSYVVNVEQTGTYQVSIQETFTNPSVVCSSLSSIVTINASASSKLFIFPSPNDGRFTISYYNSTSASTKRKIAIFDSKGALVYNREFSIAGPYTLLSINMERASRGIYYVVVGDANGSKLADGRVHVR